MFLTHVHVLTYTTIHQSVLSLFSLVSFAESLVFLTFCYLVICLGWWNMQTLFWIQNWEVSPLLTPKCQDKDKDADTYLFQSRPSNKVHVHLIVALIIKCITLFCVSLCRSGDVRSWLPPRRSWLVWQEVDRKGLHCRRPACPLWDFVTNTVLFCATNGHVTI